MPRSATVFFEQPRIGRGGRFFSPTTPPWSSDFSSPSIRFDLAAGADHRTCTPAVATLVTTPCTSSKLRRNPHVRLLWLDGLPPPRTLPQLPKQHNDSGLAATVEVVAAPSSVLIGPDVACMQTLSSRRRNLVVFIMISADGDAAPCFRLRRDSGVVAP